MLAEGLHTLAAQAGWTVVAAAATDVWDTARCGFVELLGRGDPQHTRLAEQRLEETHEQLMAAAETNTGEFAPYWPNGGRGGWRTCWRRSRTRKVTCALWYRRFSSIARPHGTGVR